MSVWKRTWKLARAKISDTSFGTCRVSGARRKLRFSLLPFRHPNAYLTMRKR
jgi:hypothetical protein